MFYDLFSDHRQLVSLLFLENLLEESRNSLQGHTSLHWSISVAVIRSSLNIPRQINPAEQKCSFGVFFTFSAILKEPYSAEYLFPMFCNNHLCL